MNSVNISGRLTKDPELVETSGDSIVCRFGVAVEERRKVNEEWTTIPHFVDCTIFGGFGNLLAEKARKGDLVAVSGRLDFSKWEDKDGNKRSKLQVVARDVEGEFKFTKKGEERPASEEGGEIPAAPGVTEGASGSDDDIPF